MPGQAVAQTLKYAEVVDVDMDATNDVNFADVEDYGHRVVVDMDIDALNNYLGWYRSTSAARPSAKLNPVFEADFKSAVVAALNSQYVDIDGVVGGLHFGTDNMNLNSDARLRAAGVSANDIPLAFVLYKLYGASAATTLDTIYNLEDAHGMLSSETVAEAIVSSFKGAEAGAVDQMFRDLLAADPHRFFDASGIPQLGIFESKMDAGGYGGWNITAGDILEVRTKLIFHSKVTRRGVAGREHLLTSSDSSATQENQQTVISPDDYFYIRLQLKATAAGGNTPSAARTLNFTITSADNAEFVGKTITVRYDTNSYQTLAFTAGAGMSGVVSSLPADNRQSFSDWLNGVGTLSTGYTIQWGAVAWAVADETAIKVTLAGLDINALAASSGSISGYQLQIADAVNGIWGTPTYVNFDATYTTA